MGGAACTNTALLYPCDDGVKSGGNVLYIARVRAPGEYAALSSFPGVAADGGDACDGYGV